MGLWISSTCFHFADTVCLEYRVYFMMFIQLMVNSETVLLTLRKPVLLSVHLPKAKTLAALFWPHYCLAKML